MINLKGSLASRLAIQDNFRGFNNGAQLGILFNTFRIHQGRKNCDVRYRFGISQDLYCFLFVMLSYCCDNKKTDTHDVWKVEVGKLDALK